MNDIYAMAGITKQGFYGRLSRAKKMQTASAIRGAQENVEKSTRVLERYPPKHIRFRILFRQTADCTQVLTR